MPRTTLSGKELLVMLLYAPDASGALNVPIRGRTRLVKTVYLFRQELYKKFKFDEVIQQKDLPNFKAWDYGPFSRDVYQDLEFLLVTDFVVKQSTGEAPAFEEVVERSHVNNTVLSAYDRSGDAVEGAVSEFEEEQFSLTDKGRAYAEERVWSKLSSKQKEGLAAFKDRLTKAPLIAILKYVYENYPAEASKSKIKEKVLRY